MKMKIEETEETNCSPPSSSANLSIYGTLPSHTLHLCGVVLKHRDNFAISFLSSNLTVTINKDAELKEMKRAISGL
jgi:hypothetical protein